MIVEVAETITKPTKKEKKKKNKEIERVFTKNEGLENLQW